MTQPMAFRGTYADWKLIKTRGVVQVVMEVPLADADAAYKVLGGMPDFSQEVWFAIAPLKADEPAEKVKKDWRDIQPSAQAAMLCEKNIFRAFLADKYPDEWHESMTDAAECIRLICAVESRSMLNDGAHRVLWHQLQTEYDVWQRVVP